MIISTLTRYIIPSLLFISFSVNTSAVSSEEFSQNGAVQSILSHWFSVNPQAKLEVSQQPLPDDEVGAQTKIEFVSDDGQKVNGRLAYPPKHTRATKLALLMHPMGTSHKV